MLELDTRIVGREAPVDLDGFLVASLLPGRYFTCQLRLRTDALAQAILTEHGEFNLSHVEPASVLGGGHLAV